MICLVLEKGREGDERGNNSTIRPINDDIILLVHSLKERSSVHWGVHSQRIVKVSVVSHGPDDLLCPGGAAFWVGHHHHVTALPLVPLQRSVFPTLGH